MFWFSLEELWRGTSNEYPQDVFSCRNKKLTLVMLNKLKCLAHFQFSASQIIWSRLLILIHKVNGKQCRSRSVGFFRSQHLDLHCLQRQEISGFSRTRVKYLPDTPFYLELWCWYELERNIAVRLKKIRWMFPLLCCSASLELLHVAFH